MQSKVVDFKCQVILLVGDVFVGTVYCGFDKLLRDIGLGDGGASGEDEDNTEQNEDVNQVQFLQFF